MKRQHLLLVGNGVNLAFEKKVDDNWIPSEKTTNFKNMSWKNIIKQLLFNSDSNIKYDDISKLPFTMQIVVATKDNVKGSMKDLTERLLKNNLYDMQKQFLQKLLRLPTENILTTNYSYEIERAAGIGTRKYDCYKCRKSPENIPKSLEKLRIYTYSELTEKNKKIWHIHGDASTPDSVIMGQFYYGKLLREIQIRVRNFMPYYKGCINRNEDFNTKSWVDLFLTRDVYMIGFGFDFSEMDLWWLAACKKKDFPNTKIHYYAPNGETKNDKKALFDAYNICLHEDFEVINDDYKNYYEKVLDDIEGKMKEGNVE